MPFGSKDAEETKGKKSSFLRKIRQKIRPKGGTEPDSHNTRKTPTTEKRDISAPLENALREVSFETQDKCQTEPDSHNTRKRPTKKKRDNSAPLENALREVSPETQDKCQTIPKSHLLGLPAELLQDIASYHDQSTTSLLRLTCVRLNQIISPLSGPLSERDTHAFFRLLGDLIPAHLDYCPECIRYHPRLLRDRYAWVRSPSTSSSSTQFYCLRHYNRTGCLPPALRFAYGPDTYVCRHCLNVRKWGCTGCRRCETCAGVRLSARGMRVDCKQCDGGKARCTVCGKVRLPRPGCQRCGKCEKCAGVLFQSGVVVCVECGGDPRSRAPATRRAWVETGRGYTMEYYDPKARAEGDGRKIGVR